MCRHDGSRLAVSVEAAAPLLQEPYAGFPSGLQEIPFFAHFHHVWGMNLPWNTLAAKSQSHPSHLLQRGLVGSGPGCTPHFLQRFFGLVLSIPTSPDNTWLCHQPHTGLFLHPQVQNMSQASPTPGSGLVRLPLWHATTSPAFLSSHIQALQKRRSGGWKQKWEKPNQKRLPAWLLPFSNNP